MVQLSTTQSDLINHTPTGTDTVQTLAVTVAVAVAVAIAIQCSGKVTSE
jgi:hypothetical protein